jgi:hypothetical protein
MSETTYTLNPCNACNQYFRSKGECNLHQLNNCFVETATAFTGIPSTDSFRGQGINVAWEGCINNLTRELGRIPCQLRMSMSPSFAQVPHFFPQALVETEDKDMAYASCMAQCDKLTNNKNQCKINCRIDRDTVVSIDKPNQQKTAQQATQDTQDTQGTKSSSNKTIFISLGVLILLAIGLFLILSRKK